MVETTSSRPSRSDPQAEDEPPPPAGADPSHVQPSLRLVALRGAETIETTDESRLDELLRDPDMRVWIDLVDPSPALVARIGDCLGLHPLVAGNIIEANARARVDTFDDDVVHVVMFALEYLGEVVSTEIDFVLGRRFLMTVHNAGWDHSDIPHLQGGAGPVLAKGADFVMYVLIDSIVDSYFPVLDKLADEVDQLQDDVVELGSRWTLDRLFVLKRELIALRRALSPAREILNQLTNRDLAQIAPQHVVYYRDVYDHLLRATDELDNYRDLVSGTLEVYLSTVNNNLSNIMKRLTGVTVILAGIGAVAGIFGMSEAASAVNGGENGGFWLIVGIVILGAAITAAVLRRIDWI